MKKNLQEFQRYIVARAYDLSRRPPKPPRSVLVDIEFQFQHHTETIATQRKRGVLNNIAKTTQSRNPENIIIDLTAGEDIFTYTYYVKDMWLEREKKMNHKPQQFVGFKSNQNKAQQKSEVNIDEIIQQRLDEIQQEQRLKHLEKREIELQEEIKKRDKAIEKMQEVFDEMTTDKEELSKIIENKSKMEYFAGIFGDVLESLGVQKESLAKPLAGLLSGAKAQKEQQEAPQQSEDESGIVDEIESSVEEKDDVRVKAIKHLKLFVEQIDNPMLFHVYSICTEIQKRPDLAEEITEFIETKNTDNNE